MTQFNQTIDMVRKVNCVSPFKNTLLKWERATNKLLFETAWTVFLWASLSVGFPRQEYWSELPFPSPESFPNPGIEPVSPALQMDSLLNHQECPKTVYVYSGILLSHKRSAFESVLMRWLNLEPIIQSELSEKEKQKLYMNAYIWNLERWYYELTCRAAIEMQT